MYDFTLCEFANSVDVPKLDGFIDGSGGGLPVIWGESNGENVVGVIDKGLVGLGGRDSRGFRAI